MKLKTLIEVMKEYENGSKSSFRYGDYVIKSLYNAYEIMNQKWVIKDLVSAVWEEIKPVPTVLIDVKTLFKLFHWSKYIAVERNGDVVLSDSEIEYDDYEDCWVTNGEVATISTTKGAITTITFEQSPICINDLEGE